MLAESHDKASTPLYWNLIDGSRATNGDLLYIDDSHQLTGYLGFFLFEKNIAEITAIVDPHYRKAGIFSELLDYAMSELRKLHVDTIRLKTPSNVLATQKTLNAIGAEYRYAEYSLVCDKFKPYFQICPIQLIEGNNDLLDEILKLNQVDQYSIEEQLLVRAHFKKVLEAEDRQCLIGYINHQPVGIIHAQVDPHGIHLHDFNFKPPQQFRKYKFDFLNKAMLILQQQHNLPFTFVVKDHQWACIDQFFKQGFYIEQSVEYWKIPIAEHERTVRKSEKLVN